MSDLCKQISRSHLISKFRGNTEKKKSDDTLTVPYLQSRITLLEKYWSEFLSAHYKLLDSSADLEHDYFKNSIFDCIEEDYVRTLSFLNDEIEKRSLPSSFSRKLTESRAVNNYRRVPTLEVPKFSGRQQDWEPFKELFCSIIKDDISISNVEKLQHLLNSVEGTAANSLKGIKVTNANFSVAWEKLLRRYDNRRIRLSKHLDNLINLKAVSRKCASEINHILDVADESIKGLVDLGCEVDDYDVWFVHLISRKLDHETREDWEISQEKCTGFSTFESLRKFLESRVRSLEQAHASASSSFGVQRDKNSNNNSLSSSYKSEQKMKSFVKPKSVLVNLVKNSNGKSASNHCKFCSASHKLKDCDLFRNLTVDERRKRVLQQQLCFNCLSKDHRVSECPSTAKCFICEERHHVKLHVDKEKSQNLTEVKQQSSDVSIYSGIVGAAVLLATAQIKLCSSSGDVISIRALIDPGAEASFISERVASLLCLPRQIANVSISGVGASKTGTVKTKCFVTILSNISEFSLSVTALVLDKLTADLPGCVLNKIWWSHLDGLELADPLFHRNARIDMILGADVYSAILMEGVRHGSPGTPIAQRTRFGWVLTGLVGEGSSDVRELKSNHVCLEPSLESVLVRFWEVEDIPTCTILSEEDKLCEDLYKTTTYRRDDGRYVVRLPRKIDTNFPDSRNIAVSCFLRGEKRLSRIPELREKYSSFMEEYWNLGQMRKAEPILDGMDVYYLPHHAVMGKSGKLRVVFNASQRCSSNLSLNDVLYSGPKLQRELCLIICRWRLFRYVFTCDIVKMFRQILVAEQDLNLQRIVWRAGDTEVLQDFTLLTVTYGMSPAPYLAIRTLLQLAEDEDSRYPEAAEILRKLGFMDDFLAGGDTLESTRSKRNQLIEILASAGMTLSKWSANDSRLVEEFLEESDKMQSLELNESVSTLGLTWFPYADYFSFKVSLPSSVPLITKRTILSEIARLFDPLGWLSPILVRGKIVLQDLWISRVGWDTPVPSDLLDRWLEIRSDLTFIEEVRIPRWIGAASDSKYEVHGFCDASNRAYAAVVYLKSEDGTPCILMSKTKVSPIKTISIPRLELSGALLLARLLHYVLPQLPVPTSIYCWTDSSVVLAWLSSHPSKWGTFVSNRVSEILQTVPDALWLHVPSKDNPADCASRGTSAESLIEYSLWWCGPIWLSMERSHWPTTKLATFETDLERRASALVHNAQPVVENFVLLSLCKFSSLSKAVAVLAWCIRWLQKFRQEEMQSFLSASEIKNSREVLWRLVQHHHFAEDIELIENNSLLSKRSLLRRLKPFLDDRKMLRIGGRLQNSNLSYSEKYPVILPKNSYFSRLLVEEAHRATLHGGLQLMQSYINRSFWILKGRRLIQQVYRNCPTCIRYDGRTLCQQMAPLPSYRLSPQRSFSLTGLDYAGPFPVRTHKGRGHRSSKGYVAIFVCMVTRAVHLEVVSDMTAATFLAAYRRFTSRRGNCYKLFSDNATTFRRAASELSQMFMEGSTFNQELVTSLARDGVQWSFIPPRAPHFGGLWEAAVRSFKHHLKRIVGSTSLTFEEFSTLTAQIEACLNSRPLCPMSNDANDVSALTPGHFLVGESLKTPLEPCNETDINKTYTDRWKHLVVMRNHFWKRWQKEVLHQLQQRNKWLKPTEPLKMGDLVLLKDEQLPPTRWPMARVTKLYTGSDGLVRVVDVRTSTGQFRRPLVKMVKLMEDPEAVAAHLQFIN